MKKTFREQQKDGAKFLLDYSEKFIAMLKAELQGPHEKSKHEIKFSFPKPFATNEGPIYIHYLQSISGMIKMYVRFNLCDEDYEPIVIDGHELQIIPFATHYKVIANIIEFIEEDDERAFYEDFDFVEVSIAQDIEQKYVMYKVNLDLTA